MRVIELTQGRVAKVDDEDYSRLAMHSWYYHAAGYAARDVWEDGERRTIYMHRAIMDPGPGQEVDHINGDGLDNRRENLRTCSHQENIAARSSSGRPGSSEYLGVSWSEATGKWRARIRHNYDEIHLGVFESEEEAARAYDRKALELRGEFATLNFPQEVEPCEA